MSLSRVAEEVWKFRDSFSLWWPTPPEDDALRFAFCEAAEAMDAILRHNPIYVRNHERSVDLAQELAQCAIMLITALGRGHRYGLTQCRPERLADQWQRVDEVARRVGHTFVSYQEAPGASMWRVWAEAALIQILDEPAYAPMEAQIGRELARLEASLLAPRQRAAVEKCKEVANGVQAG